MWLVQWQQWLYQQLLMIVYDDNCKHNVFRPNDLLKIIAVEPNRWTRGYFYPDKLIDPIFICDV